jgi:hypothetical protein
MVIRSTIKRVISSGISFILACADVQFQKVGCIGKPFQEACAFLDLYNPKRCMYRACRFLTSLRRMCMPFQIDRNDLDNI